MCELVRTTLCAILASTVMLQYLSHATSIHKHRKHHKHRFSSFSRHRGDIHSRRPYSDSRLELLCLGREPGPNGAVPLNTIIGEIKRSQPQLRVALGLSPLGPKCLATPHIKSYVDLLARSYR